MYGWRLRIGIILPSNNTVMESEFNLAVRNIEGISIHTTRIFLDSCDEQSLIKMESGVERAAFELSSAEIDVIVYGCTSGSFIGGFGWDKKIVRKINDIAKVPATTTSTAALEAFKRLGIKTLCFGSPYSEEINKKAKEFFSANGVNIISMKALNIQPDVNVGKMFPNTSYKLAKDIFKPEADGIFLSCTDFRTFEVINVLERELKKPVLSSNQVSLWHALRLVGIFDEIPGLGSIFER